MPPMAPPPRRMVKPPSIFDKQKKKKSKYNCCPDPKPENDGEGRTVCMSCFSELADSGNIVSEVQFSEDSRGAATAQGGYVTNNARHANTLGAGARRLGGSDRDPGQNAVANAKRILGGLCPRLNLSDTIRDQAVNLYSLASASNFSAGRRTEEVVAACLYAVCRRQKQNQVLLIDISELQRINVFRLGDVYKALCKTVYLEVGGKSSTDKVVGEQHQLEVESLVMKYCRKLEFGDKTRRVAEDAVRILRRMKRDWIVTGRHPAGLCGACIIYAARMNNFRRTKREVVYVVKVGDVTVAERMKEFQATRSAALSVEEFRLKGHLIKETHEPPSIGWSKIRRLKYEEKKRKRQIAQGLVPDPPFQFEDSQPEAESQEPSAAAKTPEPNGEEDGEGSRKRLRLADGTPAPTQQEPRFDAEGFAIPALPASMMQQDDEERPKKRGRQSKKDLWVPTNDDLVGEVELEREIQEMLDKDNENDSLRVAQAKLDEDKARERDEERERKVREGAAGEKEREPQQLGRTVTFEDTQPMPELQPMELVTAEDLEAEFADDLEVMNCLLPERDRKVKEQIWVAENEDWMRVQVVKEIEKKLNKETKEKKAGKKGAKGRKKKGRMGDGSTIAEATTPIETPLDANRAMFERRGMPKGISKHINYDALKSAYAQARSPSSTSQSRATSEAATSRAPSAAPTEDSRESGSPTPAPSEEHARTPSRTQRPQATAAVPAAGPEARGAAEPMTPPQTQAQATAGAEEGQDEEDDGEGDAGDYDQEDELDYGSDDEGRGSGGWLGGDDDDEREDIGEDDYGPLSRQALPRYGDDDGGDEYD